MGSRNHGFLIKVGPNTSLNLHWICFKNKNNDAFIYYSLLLAINKAGKISGSKEGKQGLPHDIYVKEVYSMSNTLTNHVNKWLTCS